MYRKVAVKYHDPINADQELDEKLILGLIRSYYCGIVTYLNETIFDIDPIVINDRKYYRLVLSERDRNLKLLYPYAQRYAILIDQRVKEFAVIKEINDYDFYMRQYAARRTYIDVDGIGVMYK